MDIQIRQCLTKAETGRDPDALKRAYHMIKGETAEKTVSETKRFCPELYVLCAEQALQLGNGDIAEDCLRIYLEGNPPANQFLCRAYLCQGQLYPPQSTASVEEVEKALMYFLKAIEIVRDKPRYHFLVFNASVLYFRAARPLLRPGQRRYLVSTLSEVVRVLDQVQELDYDWRAQLMLQLVECLVDAGKSKEAACFAKVTSDFIETHKPDLYPKIFALQVRHKLADLSKTLKKGNPILSVIYKMETLKHTVELNEVKKEDLMKLQEIFQLLIQSPQTQTPGTAYQNSCPGLDNASFIHLAYRTEVLLELAFLSMQLNLHQVATDCLAEMRASEVSNVGQRIMMECIQCELDLYKQRDRIEDYSKSRVEAQLSVISRLDVLLQSAVREGDIQATHAVCASQWNVCLPLLQRNLRKNIKNQLTRVAQALEDTHSVLLEMRCQLHSELAAIEEDEERLEPAVRHLQKALDLDQGGLYHDRLSTSLHLLKLRLSLYNTPSCPEDVAAKLIQQAKEGSGHEKVKRRRPILVGAGIALAPDTFQMVLDADSEAKVFSGSSGETKVAQLAAKAQHHTSCMQKIEGHLSRQGNSRNYRKRVKLWAALAKASRKQEVWDVCRAACRFCLLYDDRPWTTPKKERGLIDYAEKDLLRLLAEVHFINAEATVHKLRSEGVELNGAAVLPDERWKRASDDDPQWILYRDWIQSLSDYATANFIRGAELGVELGEAWLVANAAVYLWNYNREQLASKEYQHLLPTFSKLVELLKQTGHAGEVALLVLLCNTVAQGLIQPCCVTPGSANQEQQDKGKGGTQPHAEKTKKGTVRGTEKPGSSHGLQQLDPAALADTKKALELCDYALHLSNGNETNVPIAVRKQVITTWVKTKQLLQQQIGHKLDTDDEGKNEVVMAMSRVLVAVEMLLCNSNVTLMEFTVPSLSLLVRMATDCKWSDSVVELHVWLQLARSAHQAADHDTVITCTNNALQLERSATQRAGVAAYGLYNVSAVQEMLSSVACLRGLSMLNESSGHPQSYRAALDMLQSSVSYAEKAGSSSLCVAAVTHYWNACLALLSTPEERRQLREPLETILKAMTVISAKQPADRRQKHTALNGTPQGPVTSQLDMHSEGNTGPDLPVKAGMYYVLFHIYEDRGDWRRALQMLDHAITEMPRNRHRMLLLKQRVLLKARLGECMLLDLQKLREEKEEYLSLTWIKVALCATDTLQQLQSYQNAITALQSVEGQLQKAEYLLEFGEWLYYNHFPLADALMQIHWAIDILLFMIPETKEEPEETEEEGVGVASGKDLSQVGVERDVCMPCLSELKELKRLDNLVRAHTLIAFMEDRTSPTYQHNLLLAYTFVLQIWQVSMATAQGIIKEMSRNPPVPSDRPVLSAASKKEKEKGKKPKESPLVEDKPKVKVLESVLPSSPEEWAQYECPEEVREVFRSDSGAHCINTRSLNVQTRTLYFLDLLVRELESASLHHLTFVPLHLAEVIAHDLCRNASLSDLYRLRIVKNCCDLGLESASPYREKVSSIHEEEQMECQNTVIVQRERNGFHSESGAHGTYKRAVDDCSVLTRKQVNGLSVWDIWMDKADVCLKLGLYQSAGHLLTQSQVLVKELGDCRGLAKSFLLQAILANQQQNYSQALALLNEAQDVGGDEEFWYQVTLALLEATVGQGGEDTYTQVCQIAERACSVLSSALEQRGNRARLLRYYIASIETKASAWRVHLLTPPVPSVALCDQSMERLTSVTLTLQYCSAQLLQLGYTTQAAEAVYQQAQTLRLLAVHTSDKEEKQRHLLECLSLLQQAVSLQEGVLFHTLSVFTPQQAGDVSLPAERVCVRFRLTLVDLALFLLELWCVEKKQRAQSLDRKPSLQRAVEEYIMSSADLSPLEQEWRSVCHTLGQVILTQLCTVNTHSRSCAKTRARVLGMMGKCLRLLALQKDPLYLTTLWETPVMEDGKMELRDMGDLEKDEGSTDDSGERSEENKKAHVAKGAELLERRLAAQQLLAQASETLAQSVALSLQLNLPTVLSQACTDMLECHGLFDVTASGQYLALLQSCCCCVEMAELLNLACSNTTESRLSGLLHLQRKLESTYGQVPSTLLSELHHSLSTTSKAYSHLTINPNHLNILPELPPNLKILLLQHSENGSELYGAFYERPKVTEVQKGKNAQAAGTLTCTRVAKASVRPAALLQLRQRVRVFRQQTGHALVRESHRHNNMADGQYTQTMNDSESKMASLFDAIVEKMEEYLDPVLSQFDFSCFRPHSPSISIAEAARPRDKEERAATDKAQPAGSPAELGEYVVLLADWMLLELPLEALAFLQQTGISSVSRDFSLQVLHSRLHKPVESDQRKDSKSGKGAKGKGDQSRSIKVAPVNRVLPPHTLPVDTHNFKYIVDPRNEAAEPGWCGPAERIQRILETYAQPFTSHWEGTVGSEHRLGICVLMCSLTDVMHLMTNCSAFVFSGAEPLLSNIPPSKLALLNLSECQMVILFELVQNGTSMLSQSTEDVQNSLAQLALKASLHTAGLFSLSGVHSIMLNQWPCSASTSAHNMDSVMENLLKVGLSSGQTVHALRAQNKQKDERTFENKVATPGTGEGERMETPTMKVNKKFSSLVSTNSQLRQDIETMRGERDKFMQMHCKLKKELWETHQKKRQVLEEARENIHSREEAQARISRAFDQHFKDDENCVSEIQEIFRELGHTQREEHFLEEKNKARERHENFYLAVERRAAREREQRVNTQVQLNQYEVAVKKISNIIENRSLNKQPGSERKGRGSEPQANTQTEFPHLLQETGARRRCTLVGPIFREAVAGFGAEGGVERRGRRLTERRRRSTFMQGLWEEEQDRLRELAHVALVQQKAQEAPPAGFDAQIFYETYMEREDLNFALFNYVSEQNRQIVDISKEVDQLKKIIELQERSVSAEERSYRDQIWELGQSCQRAAQVSEAFQTAVGKYSRTLSLVKAGVLGLASQAGIDHIPLETGGEWTDDSVTTTILSLLGQTEQRVTELMTIRSFQVYQGMHSSGEKIESISSILGISKPIKLPDIEFQPPGARCTISDNLIIS
ncbi:cilia- and flagella-associated protein 46 [Chanos chanos]|uniref:Cilia- and flagella-associated protein 46 n=1 Tax=Chanos chanos TaxID=29144 RepID=A0A6J2VAC2_CHACN|nr:cilia- and flagella-associated protein 46 [Chanos chanos]